MNSMTFQKEGDYIVCYVNGKEVNRSKLSKAGETEQDVIDTINEQIKANPTLAGTESGLNGLEVDGTKYKVGGGSEVHLYHHYIKIVFTSYEFYVELLTPTDTAFTKDTLRAFLFNNGNKVRPICSGYYTSGKIATNLTAANANISRVTGYDITNDTYWTLDIESSSTSFTDKIIKIF